MSAVSLMMDTVLRVVKFAIFAAAAYAFVHATLQRSDAYTATDKLTKPVWLVILGSAAALALLTALYGSAFEVLFPAIAAVASGIYLVDVRPRLLEIQGKSR